MTINSDDRYVEKYAYEEWDLSIDWTGKVPSGITSLATASVDAIDVATGVADATVVGGSSSITNLLQTHKIQAGTPGKTYLLRAKVTGAGFKRQTNVILKILEG